MEMYKKIVENVHLLVNEYRAKRGLSPKDFEEGRIRDFGSIVESVLTEEDAMSSGTSALIQAEAEPAKSGDICEECKEAGFTVSAHYREVPASRSHTGKRKPPQCYYHRMNQVPPLIRQRARQEEEKRQKKMHNGQIPVDTDIDAHKGSVIASLLEKCKFGETPKGVCLTKECREVRHALDTSGYCRTCKIAHGLPVGHRTSVENPRGVTKVEVVHEHSPYTVSKDFIKKVWSSTSESAQLKTIEELWDSLNPELQTKLATRAMEIEEGKVHEHDR